jgi:POT family proton-dependent oligopeptide transporter
MTLRSTSPTRSTRRKHPPGLPVLFFTEMWERFSFYCMLSILTLYMNESLKFDTNIVGQIYGGYVGLVYFTPLLGGLLADRVLGFRKAIVLGGISMGIGHALLAFPPLPTFFAGLTCLIIGNGLFKPNISTILGNLYRDLPEKRDNAYNIFYMGINIGAFMSPLVAAYLRNNYGWHYAFGAAGFGMVIAVSIFTLFRKYVAAGEIGTVMQKGGSDIKEVKLTRRQERERVFALLMVFAVVIVFWMAFKQQGFTLTFWARDCTRTSLSPELFQTVNPAFILIFTPLLVTFWNTLRGIGREPATASKIAVGMLLTSGAYAVIALAGRLGGDFGRVNASWLIGTYAVITLAELCLSPMGLSLVSKLAPPRMRGMLMGGWFCATAVGAYLAGFLGTMWDDLRHSSFFAILVVASLAAFLLLLFVIKRLHGIIVEAEEMARQAATKQAETQ